MNEYEKLRNLNKFKKWKFKEGLEKFSYRNVMLNHTGTGNVSPSPGPIVSSNKILLINGNDNGSLYGLKLQLL
jgi:hypothetical protein